MAMEEIITRLGLDDSPFARGMARALNTLQGFHNRARSLVGGIQNLLAAGLAAKAVKSAIDYGGALTDAATAARTTAEVVGVLNAKAVQTGAGIDQLRQIMVKTSTQTADAIAGNEKLGAAYAALHIDTRSFLALPVEERLAAIGRGYVDSGKSQEAYNAMVEIFGERVGPKMVEVLEDLGTRGFSQMRREAIAAGLVLSELDAQNLDSLGDAMTRWKTRALVAIGEVVSGLTDLYKRLSGEGINAAQQTEIDVRTRKTAEFLKANAANMGLSSGQQKALLGNLPGTAKELVNGNSAFLQAGTLGLDSTTIALTKTARAQIEEEVQAELAKIAREGIEKREETEQAQTRAAGEARMRDTVKIAKILADGEKNAQRALLDGDKKLLVLRAQMVEQGRRLADTTLTQAEREDAARKFASLRVEEARTLNQLADDETKQKEKQLQFTREQIAAESELEKKRRDAIDSRLGFSVDEAASGKRGGGGVSAGAREIQRVEDQARRKYDEASRYHRSAQNYLGPNGEVPTSPNLKRLYDQAMEDAEKAYKEAEGLDEQAGKMRGELKGLTPAERDRAEEKQARDLAKKFHEKALKEGLTIKDLSKA
jgi:hypothetical protein